VNSDEYRALLELKAIFKSVNAIKNEDITLCDNIYIARLDLDNYARCRIVELNDYIQICTVDLFDLGFKIKINYASLRLLPKSSSIYSMPSIINEFVMAELIISREYEDYRQKLHKFNELLTNKCFDMEIMSEVCIIRYNFMLNSNSIKFYLECRWQICPFVFIRSINHT